MIHKPDLEPLSFPFGRDQDDYLPFRTVEGFAALRLDLIEGFAANSDGSTAIVVVNNAGAYHCTEPVPALVRRVAFYLERRRGKETVQKPGEPVLFFPRATPEEDKGSGSNGTSVNDPSMKYRVQLPGGDKDPASQ